MERRDEAWYCGAFEPALPDRMPYRCTQPHGHDGDHYAVVDGRVVARWAQRVA